MSIKFAVVGCYFVFGLSLSVCSQAGEISSTAVDNNVQSTASNRLDEKDTDLEQTINNTMG